MAITKSIIELTNPVDSCDLVEGRSRRKRQFDNDVTMFYDNDRCGLPSTHNRPLYVTASGNGVELKRAMLDPGSSINIISLSTLDAVGVPQNHPTANRGVQLQESQDLYGRLCQPLADCGSHSCYPSISSDRLSNKLSLVALQALDPSQ